MTITNVAQLKAALERSKTTPIIIKLHATWCGHCQTFAPEWNKLKTLVDAAKVGIYDIEDTPLSKLREATDLDDFAKGLLKGGYPTVRLVYKDKVTEYNGDRTATDLVEFIKKNSGMTMSGGGRTHSFTKKLKKFKRSITRKYRKSKSKTKSKRTKKSSSRKIKVKTVA